MTDRELLELAAKAAGVQLAWKKTRFDTEWPVYYAGPGGVGETAWNPLRDDGDALRLAVNLGIEVGNWWQYEKGLAVIGSRRGSGEFWEDGERLPATRRAIVQAAAAIGEAM